MMTLTAIHPGDKITVKGWWGIQQMPCLGRGAYPWECIAKDKHPDAMIFQNEQGGWLGDYDLAGPNEYGQYEVKY